MEIPDRISAIKFRQLTTTTQETAKNEYARYILEDVYKEYKLMISKEKYICDSKVEKTYNLYKWKFAILDEETKKAIKQIVVQNLMDDKYIVDIKKTNDVNNFSFIVDVPIEF